MTVSFGKEPEFVRRFTYVGLLEDEHDHRRMESITRNRLTEELQRSRDLSLTTKTFTYSTKRPTLQELPKIEAPLLPVSNEIFPDQNWATKRYFPVHNKESLKEWDINKSCDQGKRCHWTGIHRHAMTSFDYNSTKFRPDIIGAQRNGLPEISRGDKPYLSPEYSKEFHKSGSTRPIPHFGGIDEVKTDTHIPLVEMAAKKMNYHEKERERVHNENTQIVEDLSCWAPATPLVARPSRTYKVITEPSSLETVTT